MRHDQACRDCGATVLAIMLASVTPCLADLTVCNRSDAKMHLSLGILKREDG